MEAVVLGVLSPLVVAMLLAAALSITPPHFQERPVTPRFIALHCYIVHNMTYTHVCAKEGELIWLASISTALIVAM